ncbi:MAG: response regulator [Burkholderiaceae bacterium]|jgi:two-component system response regulator DctR|nr:response regulator [Burkholderiaceae bacterium]MEB2320470.1 response regulator [Pseudomonadota bacterium]
MTSTPAPTPTHPIVYLVEDEPVLAEAMAFLLSSRGIDTEHFDSGEAFWAAISARREWAVRPGCVLLDVRMRQMSGIEVFERIRARYPSLPVPVIFLTGHGDIAMAVESLKKGAFDFFEKPFNDNRLVDRVVEAIEASTQRIALCANADEVRARLSRLSNRERDVMALVLAGRLNKVIAMDLGISMRTVEVHRANIFSKMEVRSAVELARLLESCGLSGETPET